MVTGQFAATMECDAAAGLINERRHDAQQCFLNRLNTAPCINDLLFRAKSNSGWAEHGAL